MSVGGARWSHPYHAGRETIRSYRLDGEQPRKTFDGMPVATPVGFCPLGFPFFCVKTCSASRKARERGRENERNN